MHGFIDWTLWKKKQAVKGDEVRNMTQTATKLIYDKATLTVRILSIFLFISCMPVKIFALYCYSNLTVANQRTLFILTFLFKLNSCVNPFVYARTLPEFSQIVQRIFIHPFKRNRTPMNVNE